MQGQFCFKCKQLCYQMVRLVCIHDLCVNCSTDQLIRTAKDNIISNIITCEFCGMVKILDQSVLTKLTVLILKKKTTAVIITPYKAVEKKQHPFQQLQKDLDLSKQTIDIFIKQKINSIETLMMLTQQDFKQLKIPMGQRKRLLNALKK